LPIASLIPVNWILKLLESPILGKTAQYYITKDQTKTLFVLRMKESYRQADHLAKVERLKKIIWWDPRRRLRDADRRSGRW